MVIRTRVVMAGVLLLAAVGCADGPFARVNPTDAGADVTIRLVASSDTVSAAQPYVAFQVIVEPGNVVPEPRWETTYPGLVHQGDGVFRLVSASEAVAPIDVSARFTAGTATYRIYRAPSP